MTTERAKELLPIITAFANGAEIEFRLKDRVYSIWQSTTNPHWEDDAEYRIKPEPKLRPWKPEEIPIAKFHIKHATCWVVPLQTCFNSVIFWDYDRNATIEITYQILLDEYEHSLDQGKTWHPCGVLE